MGQFYKILKSNKLGEPYNSHGKDVQSWWCQVEGQELPVMIGKMVGNELHPGQHVYGDLIQRQGKKGPYWKFQGSQVPDGVERPQDAPAPAAPEPREQFDMPAWFIPYGNMIEQMHPLICGTDSGIIEGVKPAKHQPKQDVVVTSEEIDDMFNDSDEINLDDIPF